MNNDTPRFEFEQYYTDAESEPVRYPLPERVTGTPTIVMHFSNGDRVTIHPDRVSRDGDHVVVDVPALEDAAFDLRVQGGER